MSLSASNGLEIPLNNPDIKRRSRRHTVSSPQPGGLEIQCLQDPAATFHGLLRNDTLATDKQTNCSGCTNDELKLLLGNINSKLKAKAKLAGPVVDGLPVSDALPLERTSGHPRVDLDLFLENDVSVQGGFLKGLVEIHVRKQNRQQYPILLSGGKLRVIGFESILDGKERATFYQCSALLSEVSSGTHRLYTSEIDAEGFARTAEGLYTLPFSLPLPLSSGFGTAKGKLYNLSGHSMRYIIMVSIRIKDSSSNRKSIAHFYRDCTIWPRLDPSVVLSPASIHIEARTPPEIGDYKPYVTLTLHRLYWVAGQRCFVQIQVINNSKKTLKSATLEVFQTTSIFKRGLHLESRQQDKVDLTSNACQTTTSSKKVSESILTACQSGTKGHASARGWWCGVPPGEMHTFTHSILIPADALSVPRTSLLAVSYALQVTIGAGSFLSSDTHVSVPLQIINFLSVDPPPVFSTATANDVSVLFQNQNGHQSDPRHTMDGGPLENDNPVLRDEHGDEHDAPSPEDCLIQDDDLLVQHVVSSARPGTQDAPKFANLYYQTLQDTLDRAEDNFYDGQMGSPLTESNLNEHDKSFNHQPRSHNFASRVEEKQNFKRNTLAHDRAQSVGAPKSSNLHTGSSIDRIIAELEGHRGLRIRADSHPNGGNHTSSSTLSNLGQQPCIGEKVPNKLETYKEANYATAGSMGRLSAHSGEHSSSPTYLHSRIKRQQQELNSSKNHEAQVDNSTDEYHPRNIHNASSTAFTARPSATRTQSVKDKIRELEERCSSSSSTDN
ncbi:hypothetical protein CPB83DRAFT_913135 [Crepidotus variabilis]|uniref:Arrestin C-terminal-like domain-containing protein n=1 Tax=Crepidotus variabilis TaxID=179855 RepID=A0A9P6ET31_9AGAR|nr:hypothetical protein CPB83DRAFT_913135 [Crepidotus variabilis]